MPYLEKALLIRMSITFVRLKIKAVTEVKESLLPNLGAGHMGSVTFRRRMVKSLIASTFKIDFLLASET